MGTDAISNVPASHVVVTPSHPHYGFTPTNRVFDLLGDQSGVDFGALSSFTVSGHVTLGGVGLAGVEVDAYLSDQEDNPYASAITDSEGYYTITGLDLADQLTEDYRIAPQLARYAFTPPSQTVTVGPDATNIDFEAMNSLTISGHIFRQGVGVSDVFVATDTQVVTTDATGYCVFTNLAPGFYTVTAYLARHIFEPESAEVDLTIGNVTTNFVAIPIYNVSGRVLQGTNGFPNVTLTTSNITATTDANGYYTLVDVPAGANLITPSASGYWFAPAFTNLVVNANTYEINFVAGPLYTITGRITESGTGAGFVSVKAGDQETLTDKNGYYTLTNLSPGSYTVSPQSQGYDFTPASATVTLGPSATNVDFTATGTLSISGQVTRGGTGLSGIALVANSAANYTSTNYTDSSGHYVMNNLPPLSITVAPEAPGYVFSPASTTVSLLAVTNVSGIDFSADLCV